MTWIPNAGRVSAVIAEAAADEIMPRYMDLNESDIREKQPGELVTVVDEAMEARLGRDLSSLVRGSKTLGEESVDKDPGLLDLLDGDHPVWVIDPLDGTHNFTDGKPVFAVIVALVAGGKTVAGWIHEPISGRTARAAVGQGARIDDKRLCIAPTRRPEEARGTLHYGTYASAVVRDTINRRRALLNTEPSLKCAGLEYVRLAEGGSNYSLFTRLAPWDHAAGVLLYLEAGGAARYLDGSAYRAAEQDRAGLLMATDDETWYALRRALFGDMFEG